MDTRLLAGWELVAVGDEAVTSVPTAQIAAVPGAPTEQDGLF